MVTAADTTQAPGVRHEAFRDLAYGPAARNVLDLYLPEGAAHPPLVLFIHGGSWFRGDKEQVFRNARLDAMLAQGLAVAAMNHRYSQEALWPAQRDDVLAALRFLRAGDYGYDLGRLGVWGQSSGAHLALWAGVLAAQGDVAPVSAIVGWFPPCNLHRLWHDRAADDVPRGNEGELIPTPESRLLGVDAQANKPLADAASPDIAIAALDTSLAFPPTLLVHGDADPAVSPLQSARVRDVLASRGGEVDLISIAGGGHGGEAFDAAVAPCVSFLAAYL